MKDDLDFILGQLQYDDLPEWFDKDRMNLIDLLAEYVPKDELLSIEDEIASKESERLEYMYRKGVEDGIKIINILSNATKLKEEITNV